MKSDARSDGRSVRLVSVAIVAIPCIAAGCTHPLKANLAAYQEAKRRGDDATAARYLAPDARIWFERKEGEGAPLTAMGGPYAEWDREFNSTSTCEDVRVDGRTVTYLSQEINDFYRLIERAPTKARITYYFNETGRIAGMLYVGLTPPEVRPPDRYDEFKAWAAQRYPGLLDSPAMRIPNNPQRWRALLTEWRAAAGLSAVD